MSNHKLNTKSLKVDVISSPIVAYWLSILRDVETGLDEFKKNADAISFAVGIHLADRLPTLTREIQTPVGKTEGVFVDSSKVLLISILRSGYPMCKGIHEAMPQAHLALLDVKRDEATAQPHLYYDGLPHSLAEFEEVIIPDPMLATGGSAALVIELLRERKAKKIHLVSIVSAPEGIARLKRDYPEIEITTCAIDQGLNEMKYIVPGLGDFGDRYFGSGALLITDSNGTNLSYRNGKLAK